MYPTRIFTQQAEPELLVTQLALCSRIPLKYLYALAYCDNKGRITPNQEEILLHLDLFAELSKELQCYDKNYDCADHFHGENLSLRTAEELKHYLSNQSLDLGWKYRNLLSFPQFKGDFLMICGFPGVGKTTYIQQLRKETGGEVLSLDDLRVLYQEDPSRGKNRTNL
jgi:hypothetical protein